MSSVSYSRSITMTVSLEWPREVVWLTGVVVDLGFPSGVGATDQGDTRIPREDPEPEFYRRRRTPQWKLSFVNPTTKSHIRVLGVRRCLRTETGSTRHKGTCWQKEKDSEYTLRPKDYCYRGRCPSIPIYTCLYQVCVTEHTTSFESHLQLRTIINYNYKLYIEYMLTSRNIL